MPFIIRPFAILVFVLATLCPAMATAQEQTPKLLLDMNSHEVLFAQNAGQPWHPASLTKLMTILLAFEAVANGEQRLDSPVIVSANALSAPPSKMGLPVDTAITLHDALYILAIKSANDIAIAVAETIGGSEERFVEMMNGRARQLGMSATRFVNPHGLHDPRQVTTARDLAILTLNIRSRFAQYDPIFATPAISLNGTTMETNNNLLTEFPGVDGMKTGYVCSSGLNIVVTADRNGRRLMAIVLGGASGRDRGEMTAQLLYSGYAGGYRGTGQPVTAITNHPEQAPVDMRPRICGTASTDYAREREQAFPAGLEGEVSYLQDPTAGPTRLLSTLGRLREVTLPRARPSWIPYVAANDNAATAGAPMGDGIAASFPLPRPRPAP